MQKQIKNTEIKNAVKAAGGLKTVASALGVSKEAIRKWSIYGIPRSEWTPDAKYLPTIEALQLGLHSKIIVSADDIRDAQNFERVQI